MTATAAPETAPASPPVSSPRSPPPPPVPTTAPSVAACKAGGYALPAVNVTGTNMVNPVLQAARKHVRRDRPAVERGAQFYAGKGFPIPSGQGSRRGGLRPARPPAGGALRRLRRAVTPTTPTIRWCPGSTRCSTMARPTAARPAGRSSPPTCSTCRRSAGGKPRHLRPGAGADGGAGHEPEDRARRHRRRGGRIGAEHDADRRQPEALTSAVGLLAVGPAVADRLHFSSPPRFATSMASTPPAIVAAPGDPEGEPGLVAAERGTAARLGSTWYCRGGSGSEPDKIDRRDFLRRLQDEHRHDTPLPIAQAIGGYVSPTRPTSANNRPATGRPTKKHYDPRPGCAPGSRGGGRRGRGGSSRWGRPAHARRIAVPRIMVLGRIALCGEALPHLLGRVLQAIRQGLKWPSRACRITTRSEHRRSPSSRRRDSATRRIRGAADGVVMLSETRMTPATSAGAAARRPAVRREPFALAERPGAGGEDRRIGPAVPHPPFTARDTGFLALQDRWPGVASGGC